MKRISRNASDVVFQVRILAGAYRKVNNYMSEIHRGLRVEEQKSQEQEGKEQFEELLESFELVHSLEELHAIVDLSPGLHALFADDQDMSVEEIELAIKNLSPEDARAYRARTSAKKDLIPLAPIVEQMNQFDKIGMLPEKDKALRARYMRLSRAVGFINKGKIRHN